MQFLLYLILGGIGMLSDYAIFFIIIESGLSYQISNFFGYLSGTIVSFSLHRNITFRAQDATLVRLFLFFSIAGLGYLTSAILLWVLIELNHIDEKLSKLITLPIVAILQYLLNRSVTFRKIEK